MVDQATHTFQVFRRAVQLSVVEHQRCAIERGADAEELALLEALQYLHFLQYCRINPAGQGLASKIARRCVLRRWMKERECRVSIGNWM